MWELSPGMRALAGEVRPLSPTDVTGLFFDLVPVQRKVNDNSLGLCLSQYLVGKPHTAEQYAGKREGYGVSDCEMPGCYLVPLIVQVTRCSVWNNHTNCAVTVRILGTFSLCPPPACASLLVSVLRRTQRRASRFQKKSPPAIVASHPVRVLMIYPRVMC